MLRFYSYGQNVKVRVQSLLIYYIGGGGGGGNAILGHVHLENPKMALENMALNSLKWPLNQKC